MTKRIVSDIEEIKRYFNRGHFAILTPDNQLDDYDNAIGDYYSRLNDFGECLDSNGSEASIEEIAEDGTVIVNFSVYDREYEKISWEEKEFKTRGKLVLDSQIYGGEEPIYYVEHFEENGGTQNDKN